MARSRRRHDRPYQTQGAERWPAPCVDLTCLDRDLNAGSRDPRDAHAKALADLAASGQGRHARGIARVSPRPPRDERLRGVPAGGKHCGGDARTVSPARSHRGSRPRSHTCLSLVVQPHCRATGMARRLLERSMQTCAAQGCARTTLLISADNEPARTLYNGAVFSERAPVRRRDVLLIVLCLTSGRRTPRDTRLRSRSSRSQEPESIEPHSGAFRLRRQPACRCQVNSSRSDTDTQRLRSKQVPPERI